MLALDGGSSFSIAEIFTGTSILVSISALLYSWRKDRVLRKKEYADRVRHAASFVTAKLERWRELSLRFFADIQPLIVDADALLLKERDVTVTRDFLWRGLVAAHADSTRRILDEQIEIAYADLYGYDANARELFYDAVNDLREIHESNHSEVLVRTQADVLDLKRLIKTVESATLGNALRATCDELGTERADNLDRVLGPFRHEMIKLIESSDSDIFEKNVKISRTDDESRRIKTPRKGKQVRRTLPRK